MPRSPSSQPTAVSQVTILTTDSNGDVDEAPLDVPLGVPDCRRRLRSHLFSLLTLPPLQIFYGPSQLALGQRPPLRHRPHPRAVLPSQHDSGHRLPLEKSALHHASAGHLRPCRFTKEKNRLKRVYASLLERPNLAGAAAIHFTSDLESKVSERFGVSTPGKVIPLGVALPALPERSASQLAIRERFDIPAERPIILFMSRVRSQKGI